MTILYFFAITLFLLLCITLCSVILVQEGKGGLGSSFGGDVSDSIFGTATADILKKFTGWLVAVFLISCVILSFWTEVMGRSQTPPPQYEVEQVEQ